MTLEFDPDNIKVTIGNDKNEENFSSHSKNNMSSKIKKEINSWDDELVDKMLENKSSRRRERSRSRDRSKSNRKRSRSRERHRRRRSSRSRSREKSDRSSRRRHRSRSRSKEKSSSSRSRRNRSRSRENRYTKREYEKPERKHKPVDKLAEIERLSSRPAPQTTPGDPHSTSRCFRCLLKGHRAVDCPNPPRCRACRQEGHMEAECPQKKINTVPGNYEISMEIEGEEGDNMVEAKPKLREMKKETASIKREEYKSRGRPRYFDPFYYRSRSPECEEQRRATFRDNTGAKDERDARTIFCMQLSPKIQAEDLYDFFSTVGKVNEVKIIYDKYQRRSKGIAYVEFRQPESIPMAISLTGQKLLGAPIQIHASQAEKNKQAPSNSWTRITAMGQPKLDIGNLHPDIKEDMLKQIFEPFGIVQRVEITREVHTGRSKGFGSITFADHASAKKAQEKLNGFELAGRTLKVTSPEDDKKNVTTEEVRARRQANNIHDPVGSGASGFGAIKPVSTGMANNSSILESDEVDRGGVNIGATGRVALMAKLAAGTGLTLPNNARAALEADATAKAMAATAHVGNQGIHAQVTTPCFQLANLFNPVEETDENWAEDIKDDIISQTIQFGGVCHIHVDQISPEGVVYIKSPSIQCAARTVQALHGRFFGGKMIKASYIPEQAYSYKFPESVNKVNPMNNHNS